MGSQVDIQVIDESGRDRDGWGGASWDTALLVDTGLLDMVAGAAWVTLLRICSPFQLCRAFSRHEP